MVDITISELPSKTSLLDSDIIPIDDGKQTFRVTGAQLREFLKVNFLSVGTEVYSQSALSTDNPGRLPLWTGEYIAAAATIYPDFYNWVKEKHPELCKTKEQYDVLAATEAGCPFYVVDEEAGSLRLPKIPLKTRYLVESKKPTDTDPTWYNVYSDGWIEQGGVVSYASVRDGYFTATFSQEMLDTNYHVSIMGRSVYRSETTAFATCLTVGNITTTGFLGHVYGISDADFTNGAYWRVEGQGSAAPFFPPKYPWVFAYNATVPASTAQAGSFQEALSAKADKEKAADIDFVNVTEAGRAASVDWGMPDYEAGVDVGTSYTPEQNGLLVVYSYGGYPSVAISVNGTNLVGSSCGDSGGTHAGVCLPAKAGLTYGLQGSLRRFYPYIGVSNDD